MKQRTTLIIIVMLLAVSTAFGQIILTNEDQGLNPRYGEKNPEFGVMVPLQNINLDQYKENYIPLGEGWLLLACFGGAWALRKKMRDER